MEKIQEQLQLLTIYKKNNKGRFTIDYSLRQNKGWNDEIGRLSEDFMVLAINNYYQNLSKFKVLKHLMKL